jgi:ATP-binding cassette, subfamily B, bacterial
MKISSLMSFLKYIKVQLNDKKRNVLVIVFSSLIHSSLVLLVPWLTMVLIDEILPQEKYELFWLCLAGLLLVPLAQGILMTFEDYSANKLGHNVVTNIRVNIFKKFLKSKFTYLRSKKSGEAIQKIIDEPEEIAHWIYITGIQILLNLFGLIFMFAFMMRVDFYLGVAAFLIFITYIIPYKMYSKKIKDISLTLFKKRGESTQSLNEHFNAFFTIKGLGIEEQVEEKYKAVTNSQYSAMKEDIKIRRNSTLTLGTISSIGIGLVYLYGGWQVFNGELTIGAIIAARMYIELIFIKGKNLYERLMQTLWKVPIANSLIEAEENDYSIEKDGDKLLETVKSISFESATFSYGEINTLVDASLSIPIGKNISIVGPSGCGKSTFLFLLKRIYDLDRGRILINEHDIRLFNLRSLRSKIMLVPQKPELIAGSIAYNLSFGMNDISVSKIEELLTDLKLMSAINKLPQKIETVVGNNNSYTFSEGQIQRFAIARAILQQPQVILLDEATSALDKDNVENVINCIEKHLPGATIVYTTHNIAVAEKADEIIYYQIDKGWIKSTHKELVSTNSSYSKHFNLSLDKEVMV